MEVRDPVCGMLLDDKTAPEVSTYEGTTYYFCSAHCRKKFEAASTSSVGAIGAKSAA